MEEKTKKTTATAGVGNAVKIYFKENLGIIVAFLVLCVFLSVFPKTSGSFFTRQNIFNVLRQISTNLFLACGMTMVIILGGIDLSVGSIIALSGCISAGCVARYNLPLPIALLMGLLVGLLVGMFNGAVISKTTIPAFIVTLATMNIAKGLAYVYTGGSPVRVVTKEWQFLGAGYVGIFPTPVVILVIVLIITAIIMNKTKMGRHLQISSFRPHTDSRYYLTAKPQVVYRTSFLLSHPYMLPSYLYLCGSPASIRLLPHHLHIFFCSVHLPLLSSTFL